MKSHFTSRNDRNYTKCELSFSSTFRYGKAGFKCYLGYRKMWHSLIYWSASNGYVVEGIIFNNPVWKQGSYLRAWVGNLGQILSDLLLSPWCLVPNTTYSTKTISSHKLFHPQIGWEANQILSVSSRRAAINKGTAHLVYIWPLVSFQF